VHNKRGLVNVCTDVTADVITVHVCGHINMCIYAHTHKHTHTHTQHSLDRKIFIIRKSQIIPLFILL